MDEKNKKLLDDILNKALINQELKIDDRDFRNYHMLLDMFTKKDGTIDPGISLGLYNNRQVLSDILTNVKIGKLSVEDMSSFIRNKLDNDFKVNGNLSGGDDKALKDSLYNKYMKAYENVRQVHRTTGNIQQSTYANKIPIVNGNTIKEGRKDLTPEQLVARDVGISSIIPETLYDESYSPDIKQVPTQMSADSMREYYKKATNNNVKNNGHVINKDNIQRMKNNYLVYDYETLGARGTSSFTPSQIAFRGKINGREVRYDSFFEMSEDSRKYFSDLMNKMEGGSLSKEEKRQLLWLRDFQAGQDDSGRNILNAEHKNTDVDLDKFNFTDTVKKEIKQGFANISAKEGTFANLKTADTIKAEIADQFGLKLDRAGRLNAKKITMVGHNISGFDNEFLSKLFGGIDITNFFDTMTIAKKLLNIGDINKSSQEALYGWSASDLEKFFGVKMEQISQKFLSENKDSIIQGFSDKLRTKQGMGLLHSAIGDIIGEEQIFTKLLNLAETEIKNNGSITTSLFETGKTYQATGSLYRANEEEGRGIRHKNGKNTVLPTNEKNSAWNNRLINKKDVYKVGEYTKIKDGLWKVELVDTFGVSSFVTGTSLQDIQDKLSYALYSRSYSDKDVADIKRNRAIENLFSNSNTFRNFVQGFQNGADGSKIKTADLKSSPNQKGMKEILTSDVNTLALLKDNSILNEILTQMDSLGEGMKEKEAKTVKNLFLSSVSKILGFDSETAVSAQAIQDMIMDRKGPKDFNSIKSYYRDFLKSISFGLNEDTYENAIKAINNLSPASGEKGLFGVAQIISNALGENFNGSHLGMNTVVPQHRAISTLENAKNDSSIRDEMIENIRNYGIQYKTRFSTNATKALYDTATESGKKAVSGESFYNRLTKIGMKNLGEAPTVNSSNSSKQSGFANKALGDDLFELEKAIKSTGELGFNYKWTDDGNIEISLFKGTDTGKNIGSSIVIPVADENGDIIHKGMKRADTLRMGVSGGYRGKAFSFDIVSSGQEIVRNLARQVRKGKISESLKQGDYDQAQSLMNWILGQTFDSASTLSTYKELKELEQDEVEGGNEKEMWPKRSRIQFKNGLEYLVEQMGPIMNGNTNQFFSNKEVMDFLMDYIVFGSQGLGKDILMENATDPLVSALQSKFGGRGGLLENLNNWAKNSLPQAQLESIKEEAYNQKYQVNFGGAQDLVAGADMNSMTKRAYTQLQHNLPKVEKLQQGQSPYKDRIQRIVSGHTNAVLNDLNTAAAYQYTVAEINDQVINDTINKQLEILENKGIKNLSKDETNYYNELKGYKAKGGISVNENGMLMTQEALKSMEGYRYENIKITDEEFKDENFVKFLQNQGLDVEMLKDLREGDVVKLNTNSVVPGSRIWGKENSKHSLVAQNGDVFKSIKRSNDGQLMLEFNRILTSAEGVKTMFENIGGGGKATINAIISDTLRNALAKAIGFEGGDVDTFVQQKGVRKVDIPRVVSQYEYLFEEALKNSSLDVNAVNEIINSVDNKALGRYFQAYDDNGTVRIKSFATRTLDSDRKLVNANGEAIFQSEKEAQKFLGQSIQDLVAAFAGKGIQVKLPTQSQFKVFRSRGHLANEYQWTRANGFDTYANTRTYGSLTVDPKSYLTIARQIAALQGQEEEGSEDWQGYKKLAEAWEDYSDQKKDPHIKAIEKERAMYNRARKATIGTDVNFADGEVFEATPEMLSEWGAPLGNRDNGMGYTKEHYEGTTYAKLASIALTNALTNSGNKAKYLKINLGNNISLSKGEGQGTANINSIYVPILKAQNNGSVYMPRDFEGSIAKIAQLLSPQSGNLKDVNVDDLQKVVSNMYVTMYHNESHKEGSLYKQASKKRAMNAMSATARGMNMAEESKLGAYDLDASNRQRLDLSDVTISKDYLKSMLNISSDLWNATDKANKALLEQSTKTLSYVYRDLINQFGTEAEKKQFNKDYGNKGENDAFVNQQNIDKIIEHISEMMDIHGGRADKNIASLSGVMSRWPLTGDMGQLFSHIKVDSLLRGNTITINSGQALEMNADFDSDKLYLALNLLSGNYKTAEDYIKTRKAQDKATAARSRVNQILARQQQAAYVEDQEEAADATKIAEKEADVAKSLVYGGKQDAYETIMAKRNFSFVGSFSNINTGLRRTFDENGLGMIDKDSTNKNSANKVYGMLANAFNEYMEQIPISSKHMQGILNEAFDENGNVKTDVNTTDLINSWVKILQMYKNSKYSTADQDVETHWQQVFDYLDKNGLFKNGAFADRQLQKAMANLEEQAGIKPEEIAQALGLPEGESYRTTDENGVVRYKVTKDQLARIFALADKTVIKNSIGNRNMMSLRWDYLTASQQANENNIGSIMMNNLARAREQYNFNKSNNVFSGNKTEYTLHKAEKNFDNGNHDYTVIDNDGRLVPLGPDMIQRTVTEAGNILYPFENRVVDLQTLAVQKKAQELWENANIQNIGEDNAIFDVNGIFKDSNETFDSFLRSSTNRKIAKEFIKNSTYYSERGTALHGIFESLEKEGLLNDSTIVKDGGIDIEAFDKRLQETEGYANAIKSYDKLNKIYQNLFKGFEDNTGELFTEGNRQELFKIAHLYAQHRDEFAKTGDLALLTEVPTAMDMINKSGQGGALRLVGTADGFTKSGVTDYKFKKHIDGFLESWQLNALWRNKKLQMSNDINLLTKALGLQEGDTEGLLKALSDESLWESEDVKKIDKNSRSQLMSDMLSTGQGKDYREMLQDLLNGRSPLLTIKQIYERANGELGLNLWKFDEMSDSVFENLTSIIYKASQSSGYYANKVVREMIDKGFEVNTIRRGESYGWDENGNEVNVDNPQDLMYGVQGRASAIARYLSLPEEQRSKLIKDNNFLAYFGLNKERMGGRGSKRAYESLDRILTGYGVQQDNEILLQRMGEDATDEQKEFMRFSTPEERYRMAKEEETAVIEANPVVGYHLKNTQDFLERFNKGTVRGVAKISGATPEEIEETVGTQEEFVERAYFGVIDENGNEKEIVPEDQYNAKNAVIAGLSDEEVKKLQRVRHTHKGASLPTKEDIEQLRKILKVQGLENGWENINLKEFGIDFFDGTSMTIYMDKLMEAMNEFLSVKGNTQEGFWQQLLDKLPEAAKEEEFEKAYNKWREDKKANNKDVKKEELTREAFLAEKGIKNLFYFGSTEEEEVAQGYAVRNAEFSTPLQQHNVLEALKNASEETQNNPTMENIIKDKNVDASNLGLTTLATYLKYDDVQENYKKALIDKQKVDIAEKNLQDIEKEINRLETNFKGKKEDVLNKNINLDNDINTMENQIQEGYSKKNQYQNQKIGYSYLQDLAKDIQAQINEDYFKGLNGQNYKKRLSNFYSQNQIALDTIGIDENVFNEIKEQSFETIKNKKGKTKSKFNARSFKDKLSELVSKKMEEFDTTIKDLDEQIIKIDNQLEDYRKQIKDNTDKREKNHSEITNTEEELQNKKNALEAQKKEVETVRNQAEQSYANLDESIEKYYKADQNIQQYNAALEKAVDLRGKFNKLRNGEDTGLNPQEIENLSNEYEEALSSLVQAGRNIGVFKGKDDNKLRSQAEKISNAQANTRAKTTTKLQTQNIQEAITDMKELQNLVGSNADPKYITALNNKLQELIGNGADAQKTIQEIVNTMSTKDKINFAMTQEQQFNAGLAQMRVLDAKQQQLEFVSTTSGDFLKRPKTNAINPWRDKMMAYQMNQIGLQKASQQAQLDMQKSLLPEGKERERLSGLEKLNTQVMSMNRTFAETQRNAMKGSLGLEELTASAKGMLKTAVQYGVVYRGAQTLIQQIYTLVGAVQQFDIINTQLRMTADISKESATSMIKDCRDVADEYGALTTDLASGAVEILRQGRSVEDTNTMMRQSAILSKVGFMEQNEAIELLTATINGFNLEAKDCADIVDLVSYTDTIAATSAQELMTAFQYVASSANVAGFSVEELNAMVATVSETTRLSASSIGQAFKTMVSRLQQVKVGSFIDEETGESISNVDKVLKQYGVNILDVNGKMKDGNEILKALHKEWNSWGDDVAKKREVVEAIAGTRQGNMAMALMDNWDRYEEIFEEVENNASGSAATKMEANSESLAASINRLKNSLQDVSSSGWAVGFYKWVVDLATGFVNLKSGILPIAGLLLMLKNNGAGVNAVYNAQIGILTKLQNLWGSAINPAKFKEMQAMQIMNAGRMETISEGGYTAFIDPVTRQASEPIANGLASRTLAFQEENNFENAMVRAGLAKRGEITTALDAQLGLQQARVNGAVSDQFIRNINATVGNAAIMGNITDEQRELILRGTNAIANSGFNSNEMNTAIANNLFTKNEQGQLVVNGNISENVENMEGYQKKYAEYNNIPSTQLEATNNLINKIVELITAIEKNTAAQNGEEPSSSSSVNEPTEAQKAELEKDKNKLLLTDEEREKAETEKQARIKEIDESFDEESFDKETEKMVRENNLPEKKRKHTKKYREELKEELKTDPNFDEKTFDKETEDMLQESSLLPNREGTRRHREELKNKIKIRQEEQRKFYQDEKHLPQATIKTEDNDKLNNLNSSDYVVPGQEQKPKGRMSGSWENKKLGTLGKGAISIGSMASLIGTSYGVSGLAEKAGMSASASSMLGMLGGMSTSMLAMAGPWGMVASVGISAVTSIANAIKEREEKNKQKIRETAKEAQDAFNQTKKSIEDLEDVDFQSKFKSLSQGVDAKGQNVSLSDEDYKTYRDMVDTIIEKTPELAKTYTAEGEAIIDRNSILKDSIKLLKEENEEKRKAMYSNDATKVAVGDLQKDLEKEKEEVYKSSSETVNKKWGTELNYTQQKSNVEFMRQEIERLENMSDFAYLLSYKNGISKESLIQNYKNRIEDYDNITQNKIKNVEKKSYQKQAQKYMQNAMIQDGYEELSQDQQEAIGQYIQNIDYSNFDFESNADEADKKIREQITKAISIIQDLELDPENKLSSFYKEKDSLNSEDLKRRRSSLIKQIDGIEYLSDKEKIDIAKGFGVIDNNYKGTTLKDEMGNYNKVAYYNSTENELRQKIAKDLAQDTIYGNDEKGVVGINAATAVALKDLTQQEKEFLNNNWGEIISNLQDNTKAIENGTISTKSLRDAISEQKSKEYERKDITGKIDNESLNKNVSGMKDFINIVKNYRENTYLDDQGNLHNVMDPETLQGIQNFKEKFQLSDDQMNAAFQYNKNGEYNLYDDTVTKAINFAVSNVFGKGKLLSLDDINALVANFDSMGITGTRSTAYAEFLISMKQQNKMLDDLDESQKKTYEVAKDSDIGKAIQPYLDNIENTTDVKKFLGTDVGKTLINQLGIDPNKVEDFANQLDKATESLGGFSGAVSAIFSAISSGTSGVNVDDIISAFGSDTGMQGLQDTLAQNNPELATLNGEEFATVTISGLLQYQNQQKANIEAWKDEIVSISNGMSNKEKKEANKQLRGLNRQLKQAKKNLKELEDQAKLDRLNLGINKVKLNFNSLAKAIDTVNSAISLLDDKDIETKTQYINEELQLSSQYSNELSNEWERLLEEYQKADTGESIQAIGEAMSEVSDNMTSQIQKQIELKKQLETETKNNLKDSLDNSINNLTDMVNRQMNILKMQRENIRPEKFNYYDVDAITSPSLFLPNASSNKDKATKLKEETRKMIDEERSRQEKLNAIKAEALDKIFEKAEQDRADQKEEIEDNINDINDQITELQDKLSGKIDLDIIDKKQKAIDAAQEVVNKIQEFLNTLTLPELLNLMGKTVTKNDVETLTANGKKVYEGINYDNGQSKDRFNPKTYADLQGTYIASHGSNEQKDFGVWTGEEKGYKFVDENGKVSYWKPNSLEDIWGDNKDNKIFKKAQSNAYADSSKPISNGPITVGEHHPEFVMFKNGEGAIFDKTTILNGNEVDFVTNASYANNGKNNGILVTKNGVSRPAYANGGNEDKINNIDISDANGYLVTRNKDEVEETNGEIIENIKNTEDIITSEISENNQFLIDNVITTDETISENIFTTNKDLLTNIQDTNTLIEKSISISNNNNLSNIANTLSTNETNITDSLNNINTIVANGLTQVQTLFEQALQNILKVSGGTGGNGSVAQKAQEFLGRPYVWGGGHNGDYSGGLDCSGFVAAMYGRDMGTTWTMRDKGIPINPSDIQAWDVIITENGGHVGMYGGDGKVYSAGSKGVTAQDYNDYWKSGEIRRLTYDEGIGTTNDKDLSHYGIMSEKRGEYKVNKETGEWTYEPYETVVDTDKYDVVSGDQSQKIRSKQFADGTINPMEIATYIRQKYPEVTDAAIAGILGNIQQESGFNPKNIGDGGKSKGLFQLQSNRIPDIDNIVYNGTWQQQIDRAFANARFENSGMGSLKGYNMWDEVLTNPNLTAEQAADIWGRKFERYGIEGNRVQYATEWAKKLQENGIKAYIANTEALEANTQALKEKTPEEKAKDEIDRIASAPKFVSDVFRENQVKEKDTRQQENLFIKYLYNNMDVLTSSVAREMNMIADRQFNTNFTSTVTVASNVIASYKQQLEDLSKYYEENKELIEGDIELYNHWKETYDNLVSAIDSQNSNIQSLVESKSQYYLNSLKLALSGIDKIYKTAVKRIEQIDAKLNMLNDFEHQSKLENMYDNLNQNRQKDIALKNEISVFNTSITDQFNAVKNSLRENFGYSFKTVKEQDDFDNILNNLLDTDGLNPQALQDVMNLVEGTRKSRSTKDNLEGVEKSKQEIQYDNMNDLAWLKGVAEQGGTNQEWASEQMKKYYETLPEDVAEAMSNMTAKEAMTYKNEYARKNGIDNTKGFTEQENIVVADVSASLQSIQDMIAQRNEKESEELQVQQEMFSITSQILEEQKNTIQAIDEERSSLYKAIIDNTTYLKNLASMRGDLLKDTQYMETSANLVDVYNKSVNSIVAYRNNDERIRLDRKELTNSIKDIVKDNGIQGVNVEQWFSASGELVADVANKEYQKLLKRWQELLMNGKQGTDEAQALSKIISSMDEYGKLISDQNENQQNLQNTITQALEEQKQLISKGQEWLEQYTKELTTNYATNRDKNDLLSQYLKNIEGALDTFNRDEQMSIIGSQLRVNKNERNNLIGEQAALKSQNSSLIRQMRKVTSDINVSSLFTSKGERKEYDYQQALKTIDELVEKGEITDGQMVSWKINLEQVEKNTKQIVDLNGEIIDNYETENSLREELTKKQIESYDWQISKMQSLLQLTTKRFEMENQIFDLRSDLDKELRSAKQSMQWLTKSERIKIFNEEDYTQLYNAIEEMENKTTDYYNEYYGQMMNLTEDTLYKQEYITNEYERRLDLVEAEYAITQKRVDLEKEQLKLKNVTSEKNSRVYMNGEWAQVANIEDVISATEAYADAEKEYQKAQKERQQKIQENQMNKYIDGLKEVQAALENSTKFTNSTEEEMLNRLVSSVEQLIGSNTSDGTLKTIINDLSTDLHNYQQIASDLIDKELRYSITNLSKITDNLQEEVEKQLTTISKDSSATSKQLSNFNDELDKVETNTLVTRFDALSTAIDDFTRSLKDNISYNTDAYRSANDIAWLKVQWQEATDRGDTEAAEIYANDAKDIYQRLIDSGYQQLAYTLQGLNGEQAVRFKDELKNTNETDWEQIYNKPEWLNAFNTAVNQTLYSGLNGLAWYKKVYENGNVEDQKYAKEQARPLRLQMSQLLSDLGENDFVELMDKLSSSEDRDALARWFGENPSATKEQRKERYDLADESRDGWTKFFNKLSTETKNKLSTITKDLSTQEKAVFQEKLQESGEKAENMIDTVYDFLTRASIEDTQRKDVQIQATETQVNTLKEGTYEFGDGVDQFSMVVDKEGQWTVKQGESIVEFGNGVDSFKQYVNQMKEQGNESNAKLVQALQKFSDSINNQQEKPKYTSPLMNRSTSSNQNRTIAYTKSTIVGTVAYYTDGSSELISTKNSSSVKKAANGVLATQNDVYNVDEIGKELYIPSGRLRQMEYGDRIVPHAISENLLKWGTMNPALLSASSEKVNNITNSDNSVHYQIDNINLHEVKDGRGLINDLNRYLQRTNSLS